MTNIERIKIELREEQIPFFEDSDFEYYLQKNHGDVDATIYEMLLIKAEDSTISVSGLSTQDTSSYFRRLASRYKRYNSGVLRD
jgi:hypothetical protein|nr:MAG TPA: DMRTA motif [Caudoviricetes sp.]